MPSLRNLSFILDKIILCTNYVLIAVYVILSIKSKSNLLIYDAMQLSATIQGDQEFMED